MRRDRWKALIINGERKEFLPLVERTEIVIDMVGLIATCVVVDADVCNDGFSFLSERHCGIEQNLQVEGVARQGMSDNESHAWCALLVPFNIGIQARKTPSAVLG